MASVAPSQWELSESSSARFTLGKNMQSSLVPFKGTVSLFHGMFNLEARYEPFSICLSGMPVWHLKQSFVHGSPYLALARGTASKRRTGA